MHQDIGNTCSEGSGLPSSGPAGANIFSSGFGPAVSHDLGSLVVEDQQVLVGFDEIEDLAGHESGDVESGSA